jgi:hypothetical protein
MSWETSCFPLLAPSIFPVSAALLPIGLAAKKQHMSSQKLHSSTHSLEKPLSLSPQMGFFSLWLCQVLNYSSIFHSHPVGLEVKPTLNYPPKGSRWCSHTIVSETTPDHSSDKALQPGDGNTNQQDFANEVSPERLRTHSIICITGPRLSPAFTWKEKTMLLLQLNSMYELRGWQTSSLLELRVYKGHLFWGLLVTLYSCSYFSFPGN